MSKKSIGSRTLKAGAALLAVGAGVAAINAKNKNGTEKKEIKEIQKKEYEQYRNTERGKYDKNSKGIYYSNGNYEAFARPEKPEGVDAKSAYIVGSGLASLAAACFLVRDGQMKGSHIHILEAMDIAGGACDGINDPTRGYVMRGGREMENHFECLWDLFRSIPSLEKPGASVLDEYYWLNKHDPNYSLCRATVNQGEEAFLRPCKNRGGHEALPRELRRQGLPRGRCLPRRGGDAGPSQGCGPDPLHGHLQAHRRCEAHPRRAGPCALLLLRGRCVHG